MRSKNRIIISRIIKIIILVYAIGGILLYYLQDKLFFRPVPLPKDHVFRFQEPFKEVNIPYKKNSTINLVQFTTKDTAKGVVLYFHGNRANVEWYAPAAPMFTRNGYEVWMMDYPGYGKSTGEFSEQELYNWALIQYKLARVRYSPDSIVIYGRSMGTGIASQLASVRDCKALILEAPFKSLSSLVHHYAPVYPTQRLISYKLDVHEHLKNVTAPVMIFAGSEDPTTPVKNSIKLKEVLKEGDQFNIIEGAKHNNLPEYPVFNHKLDSILR